MEAVSITRDNMQMIFFFALTLSSKRFVLWLYFFNKLIYQVKKNREGHVLRWCYKDTVKGPYLGRDIENEDG